MEKMNARMVIWLLAVVVLSTACSTYDDGPAFSLYSKGKRVQGQWYFSRVLYNEADSSEQYYNDRIEFSLGEGSEKDWGLYTWLMDPYNPDPEHVRLGGWNFNEEKDSLRMIVLASHQELYDTIHWRIVRLAYDEWWMESQYNDTTVLRWELWKWVF